jgi:hypothetical protein
MQIEHESSQMKNLKGFLSKAVHHARARAHMCSSMPRNRFKSFSDAETATKALVPDACLLGSPSLGSSARGGASSRVSSASRNRGLDFGRVGPLRPRQRLPKRLAHAATGPRPRESACFAAFSAPSQRTTKTLCAQAGGRDC